MIINKYVDGTKVIRNFFIVQKKTPIWSSIYYMTSFFVGSLYSAVS